MSDVASRSHTLPAQSLQDYDLTKPADIPEAQQHGVMYTQEASKVKNLSNISIYESVERCKCCLLPIVYNK